jgi:uncharacterized membrane protein YgcG
MSKRLTRLQKTGALVPMAMLVTAWGVAVGNSGLAGAIGGVQASIPEVPASALEQPAAVSRIAGGLDPQAGAAGTMTTLATNGIPSAALYAYHHAQTLLADADAGCKLPWNLIAAIGRVESNHGRTNGNVLTVEGVAKPGIFGTSNKAVKDTDNGTIDKNAELDRPVGPMQILPSTWKKLGVDSDADGSKDPQDIDDAATTTGVFLCSGTGDLSTTDGVRSAVTRYNNSADYTHLVMKVSEAYGNGQYSQTPDGFTAATILTSQANDQTLSNDDRKKAKKKEEESDDNHHSNSSNGHSNGGSNGNTGGSTGGGSTGGGSNGGSNGGSGGGSGGGTDGGNGGGSTGGGKAVENVTKVVTKTTDKVNETVKKTTDKVNETTKKLTDKLKDLGKKKESDDNSDDEKSDDSSN